MLKLLTRQNILNTWKVRGGSAYWVDRAFARHLVLIYYWVNVVYYWVAPRSAYHLSYEVEIHAAETYAKYLAFVGMVLMIKFLRFLMMN